MHPSLGHLRRIRLIFIETCFSLVYLIEKVQRAFTKHITGMRDLSYSKRLRTLKLNVFTHYMDWFQTSLNLSLALSLIIGVELVLYIMLVLVDWAH